MSAAHLLNNKQERCLALAAVFQAANLVTELAKTGECETLAYDTLIDSLFKFDADHSINIYNDSTVGLSMGLEQLSQLTSNSKRQEFVQVTKYALGLLALQKQAAKDDALMKTIHQRLQHIAYSRAHFGDEHDAVSDEAKRLSGLYQDTLSQLKFRIQVQGNMQYLTQSQISDKIRALLFAGFRAAVLWRQLGGSKWQIILKRSELEHISQQFLDQPIYPTTDAS